MKFVDWIELPGKKVIVTDHVANGMRLLRKCNREQQKDVKQVSCMPLQQIVKELLYARKAFEGQCEEIRILDSESCIYILDEIVRSGKFDFVPKECYCLRTTEEIFRSMNQIRLNTVTDAYFVGAEPKLLDLKRLIEYYEVKLQAENSYDYPLLLQKAVQILQKLSRDELEMYLPWIADCKIGFLEDMEFTGQEDALKHKLETVTGITLEKLEFYSDKERNEHVTYHFFKAYGVMNEIRYVIEQIVQRKLPYGQVNLFYSSSEYENFIKSAFGCRGIPYRFISGERAVSGYFVQFMIDVLEWAQEDFLYERLGAVIENPIMTFQNLEETEESVALKSPLTCYNKFLRQGIAWGSNRYSECIERVEEEEAKREKYAYFLQFLKDAIAIFANQPDCGEMYRRLFNFAGKYTYARNMERQQIVPVLKEQIAILNQVSKQVTQDEKFHIIKERLQKLVIKSDSDNAAVNIIKIQDLEVLERPYNYVIGLSAGQFMVDTNESPVLSDEELIRYLNGNIQLAGETGRYVRENLLRTFATLEAGEITLGYSTFDTIELKKSSPSVFYLDYLERFGKMQGQIDYFTYDIQNGVTRVGLPSYNQLEAQEIPAEDEGNMQVTMSSSGLQTLIECPLRYYYHYIEKLPRREFLQKKEYQWLDAGTKGNLFHRTMELYCNRVLMNESVPEEYAKKNVFEEIYDSVVKELLEKIPYASEALFEQEKEEGRQLIWQYLQDFQKELYTDHIQGEEKWRVLGCEQQFQQIVYQVEDPKQKDSPLTILFEGTIDRLDGYVDAEGCLYLRVIDYKTGSIKKKQEALKSNKQIQHFVYAIAAIEYAVENRDILNELFNTDIRVICVKSAQYVFPYEGSKEKVLDVTEALYANLIDDRFALPESVRDVLWNTLGLLNCGKRDLAWKYIIEYPNKEDQKQGACECEYCSYTRQCRKKLGADL